MFISVEGNNPFHTGWLARFLGLPKEHPWPPPNLDSSGNNYKLAFEDGWETCDETFWEDRLQTYYTMFERGQALVEWQREPEAN